MSDYIVNGAPMPMPLGTQDLSTEQLPRVAVAIPQHLPYIHLFAKRGPESRQLVSGVELENMYHADTFDYTKPYANHATVFAKQMNEQGNLLAVKRLIPTDAGPKASICLWLDVLETTVELFKRNDDGSIYYDNGGSPVVTGTTSGFKLKWVMTNYSDVDSFAKFGQLKAKAGTMTDTNSGVQSKMYPILETACSFFGGDGNNSGLRIWAPTADTVLNMPTRLMSEQQAYPFYLSVIRRDSPFSTPTPVDSIWGTKQMMFVLKPGVNDPISRKRLYMGDTFLDYYQNLKDPTYPVTYGDFGQLKVYDGSIKEIVEMLWLAESSHIESWSDINESEDSAYLMNFVSCVSSQNVPYAAVQMVNDADSISLTSNTNLYAAGGSDGTMDDAMFNKLVIADMENYANPNSDVQDTAANPISVIYDSGLTMEGKFAIAKIISVRRDTAVVMSTHIHGETYLTPDEEYSRAVALRTRLQMFPESDYFGTPCMRAVIIGRSAVLRNSEYLERLPLSLEIAIKAARYMGASNGKWKAGANFDGAPGSIVEFMEDISIQTVPGTVRNKNWAVGLNWVQPYDTMSFFFPALKTIYDNDTSILNSFNNMMAIAYLNKITDACWREYSGVDHLTNAQLVDRVNGFVNKRVKGIFDNRFVIKPVAQITDIDKLRGFSWTLPVKIYGPNMKTVMTSYIQSYRLDNLKAA